MPKCTRHLFALTRKNFYIWTRTWGCSAFELVAPLVLMIVLSFLRTQVEITHTDQSGMLKKKYPVMLGIGKKNANTWAHNTDLDDWVNDFVTPMFGFANYTIKHDEDDPEASYDLGFDFHGP